MKKQNGFTLIELVVVIVILGILAAVAAPKFIDLTSDARISTLKGVEGSIKSGNSIMFSKSLIDGTQNQASATVDGVDAVFGEAAATKAALTDLLDGASDRNWTITLQSTGVVHVSHANADMENCYVEYTQATDANTRATTTVKDSGC